MPGHRVSAQNGADQPDGKHWAGGTSATPDNPLASRSPDRGRPSDRFAPDSPLEEAAVAPG